MLQYWYTGIAHARAVVRWYLHRGVGTDVSSIELRGESLAS